MITPMTGVYGILLMLAVMLLLKMPVGYVMALMGFLGIVYTISWDAALGMIGNDLWNTFSSYGLTVIPMFILMGQICFYSQVNERLYNAAYKWFGKIRGGLATTTIIACAGFAAICGSNTATAATMTVVALPEMRKYKYDHILTSGSIAAGSTLGVVIPPSVVLVVYGIYTGQSIGKLFFGSFVPGIILSLIMVVTVYVMCLIHPAWGPKGPSFTMWEKIRALPDALDMLVLFGIIMFSLYAGLFTPSEAGAAGSVVAILISLARRKLTWKGFLGSVIDTLRISCMIFMLVAGAIIFGRFLAVTRLPFVAAEWVAGLPVPSWMILWAMLIIYIIGGCVMDALAFLLITVPIFYPVAIQMGYDPIWFGVVITIVTTMGAITPPVGISAYIVSGMAKDIPLSTVFRGVIWFIPSYILTMVLVEVFPQLVIFFADLVKY
ncbi:MAG TPA: TRAP transporter large permease [Syntrophorhabdaceae bacterium]|jgi:tripartite ATP-independent transporter DctM subunit|nr:TRAP transporter large permease [Syntrophorhabdaceae bacterium]MDI9561736.1 TRAP transporter large permease [Pseudomonadota bacterium]OQC47787.1 MAG: Sialic acid TRAP transporter permease protein SiaT [Deltaproteobacteria bacterium ADurb.Bin026]MBP8699123.1 TRAP transporter large permease [Syntrophorhabdaceae bacterium]HNQ62562.1 TRAP transporter large permease [Syntrophorhabdaceae bacterium]